MTADEKECYNQLLAIFLDYPEENREDFVKVLGNYEFHHSTSFTVTASTQVNNIIDRLSNFETEVVISALKQLIKIFDIKPKIQYMTVSGSYIISG